MNTNTRKISVQSLTIGGMFTALIAVGAFIKITIPVQPIEMHFTLQWFFVLMAGLLLNEKIAGLSVGSYLIIGLLGVPVFASGGGLFYLFKPTFGYLLGFFFSAIVMGYLSSRSKNLNFKKMLGISVLGLLIYYGVGVFYFFMISHFLLSQVLTWQVLLFNCFLLTAGEDLILCILAAILANRLRDTIQSIIA